MNVPVRNMAGDEVSNVELPADIFEAKINVGLMHQYVVMQQANRRLGTHKTKRRGEINRTHAKWYRQKGTGRARHGSRSAMEPDTSPKMHEHEHFARELAEALHKGLSEHAYGRLVLCANPQFLGLLREVMDPQVSNHVSASINKDLTRVDQRELPARLLSVLQQAP